MAEANARRVREFLGGPLGMPVFEEALARTAGEICTQLERSGKPIGADDVCDDRCPKCGLKDIEPYKSEKVVYTKTGPLNQ